MKVKLPDGSVVTLGGKSRVKYPAGFAGNTRDIILEGEAFFEAIKNPEETIHRVHGQCTYAGVGYIIQSIGSCRGQL